MHENSERFPAEVADTRFLSARAAQLFLSIAIVGCFTSVVFDVMFKTECLVASVGWIAFGPMACIIVTLGRIERPSKAKDYFQITFALGYFVFALISMAIMESSVKYGCLIFQISVVVIGGTGNVLFMGPFPSQVAMILTNTIRGILTSLKFFARSSADDPPTATEMQQRFDA